MSFLLHAALAHAFCGTYVGPADGTPDNGSSRLVLVHDGDRSILTMSADARNADAPFGLLVPVPADLDESAVEVVKDTRALEDLDAFTAPRVVSYTCASAGGNVGARISEGCQANCTPEAIVDHYQDELLDIVDVEVRSWTSLGSYDVAVVRSQDVGALTTWLDRFGFQLHPDAVPLVDNYMDQGVDFLVARAIDLPDLSEEEEAWPDPLRITYPERTYSLPLELGAAGADADQNVTLWVIGDTIDGEAQVVTFPEAAQENDCMLPPDMGSKRVLEKAFQEARGDESGIAVVEYSWDLGQKCDPCGASGGDPSTFLGDLGRTNPEAYVTRIRMRYDPMLLQDDLHIQYTGAIAQSQLIYVQYLDELEATFPLCFTGFPEDPAGTCDEESTQASLPWWSVLWVPLVGWGLRRRRS